MSVHMTWGLPEGQPTLSVGNALAEQAYDVLREAVTAQQIPAGTSLSVPEIARRLGISRSPVREAIARLVADGLAVAEPRRGAVVANITRDELVEIYDLREVLEGLACRLAATRLSDEELAELEELLDAHRKAVRDGDVAGHMSLDQAFHAAVRGATGNSRLVDGLDRLQGQIRLAMDATHRPAGAMEQALSEHEAIVEALRARDAVRAEQVGRRHIARLRAGLSADETDHP